jgi:hypothetical protein
MRFAAEIAQIEFAGIKRCAGGLPGILACVSMWCCMDPQEGKCDETP